MGNVSKCRNERDFIPSGFNFHSICVFKVLKKNVPIPRRELVKQLNFQSGYFILKDLISPELARLMSRGCTLEKE